MTRELPAGLTPLEWDQPEAPNAARVADRLRHEGVQALSWSNGPGDRYGVHEHGYTKLLMCAAGSITFLIGHRGEPVELMPGDGFVLPPGTRHGAVVGPAGCTCLEGHLPAETD